MAYGLLQSLLPCPWFGFWAGCIRHISRPVSPLPSFQMTQRLSISFPLPRISTQILSHHVDDFTLVSAFLLFALGCLNMLLGLIFRESAKAKRSISSWRAEVKGVLPTSQDNRPVFAKDNSVSAAFSSPSEKAPYVTRQDTSASDNRSWRSEKAGYGFGRQGEKSAALRGFILQKPVESLPRYMTPPPASTRSANLARSHTSISSTSSFYSPQESQHDRYDHERGDTPPPTFRSSPTAI